MIRYLGTGKRNYKREPIPLNSRASWEFQVIVKGYASPILPPGGGQLPERGSCLWIFPPEHVHGWSSRGLCEVLVFHLARMPEAVTAAFPDIACIELSESQTQRLQELATDMKKELRAAEGYLEALTLMVQGLLSYIALKSRKQEAARGRMVVVQKVERVMGWLDMHMEEGVGVTELAHHAGVSISHLRRLFHEAIGMGPREAVNKARLARAETLLRVGNLRQKEIAAACGFGSEQAFSRFFRMAHRCSPTIWKKQAEARVR